MSNGSPLVSVIMPAYNAESYISIAIESIINQTFKNFEFIIIDDGSTDKTAKIIRAYTDTRIKFIVNPENKGLIYTLNKSLEIAKGKYIARMDADDISYSERLEKQVNFLEKETDISVLGTGFVFMGTTVKHNHPLKFEEIKIELLDGTCFAHPSVMMRREDIINNELSYNEDYPSAEDYKLWTDFAIRGLKLANLNDILLEYRIHDSQVSTCKRIEQISTANKIRNEYINNAFDNSLSDEEISIINNIKDYTLKEALSIIFSLKEKNKNKKFFDSKAFNSYLNNKIKLVINKDNLLNVVTSKYPLTFKFWIIRKYISRIF